jgi:signal transduction histidine kinase
MTAWLRVALVCAGLALGLAAELVSYRPSALVSYRPGELDRAIADLLTGWVLIGCGLLAAQRRPQSRVGLLLAASGALWFLGSIVSPALYLHRGPLVHALLSFPTGRLSGRARRVVVGIAYVASAIQPVARSAVATLVLCALVAAIAVQRWLGETGAPRRARAGAAAGALAICVTLAFGAVGRLSGWNVNGFALWAYEIALATVALGLVTDLLRRRWSQAALTGLVVDLGGVWEPVTLRDRLATALGDRSLQLGYWMDADAGYVDETGRALVLPAGTSERTVTPIEHNGEHIAVLVHDPTVLQDRPLVESAAEATRIAVANVRLQTQVQVRVQQVAASRRRIVEAADAQRGQLARELHDGAEQRLDAVCEQVAALAPEAADAEARELLADVESQLDAARAELRELARGIRPATLTGGGLAAALPELAARASVPVDVRVQAGRLPAAVEAAAYFVCGEALANIAKYAGAARVSIDVLVRDGRVVVTVADDGDGGADPSRGSGLRGIADRVEALGGALVVDSPPGRGTRLVAELPAG